MHEAVIAILLLNMVFLAFFADGSAPATQIKRSFDARSKALPSRVPVSASVDSSKRFVYG
jgi:hypothetical protein